MATKSRAELTQLLDALEERIPELVSEFPRDGDFSVAFASEAKVIEDLAAPFDRPYVGCRLSAMNEGMPR